MVFLGREEPTGDLGYAVVGEEERKPPCWELTNPTGVPIGDTASGEPAGLNPPFFVY